MFLTYVVENKPKLQNNKLLDNYLYGKIALSETRPNKVFTPYTPYKFVTVNVQQKTILKHVDTEIITNQIRFFNDLMNNYLTNRRPTYQKNQNEFIEHRIPKRKGGTRILHEPNEELKEIQRQILDFLQNTLKILPHNAVHSYVKKRDNYTNARVHKQAKYVAELDVKDFFPSITERLLFNKLLGIHLFGINAQPFSNFLSLLVKIVMYNNFMPQGGPLSPFLSNLVLMHFDYTTQEQIAKNNGSLPYCNYTRYCDDLFFSKKTPFTDMEQKLLVQTIRTRLIINGFKLNEEKTKFLKNTNRLYITGIKLNKDNQLTIGHEKKKILKHRLMNLFINAETGTVVKEDVQSTLGEIANMSKIEPQYTRYLTDKMLRKFKSPHRTLGKHFKQFV